VITPARGISLSKIEKAAFENIPGPEKVQVSRLGVSSGFILFSANYRISVLRKGFFDGKTLFFRFSRQFT